jgi:hypothetical protein
MNGSGTYFYENGSKVTGEFRKGKLHGRCHFVFGDGTEYHISYVNGEVDLSGENILVAREEVKEEGGEDVQHTGETPAESPKGSPRDTPAE